MIHAGSERQRRAGFFSRSESGPSLALRTGVGAGLRSSMPLETTMNIIVRVSMILLFGVLASGAATKERQTVVSIEGQAFHMNGKPTDAGRSFNGMKVEGLLMNSRMVQGVFDDLNLQTRPL